LGLIVNDDDDDDGDVRLVMMMMTVTMRFPNGRGLYAALPPL
jgi:hypothetical protein